MTENEIINEILKSEGGYVNDPADRGGPTKYGITLPTLEAHRGNAAGSLKAYDILSLTEDEARDIYRQQYIRDPGFDGIHDPWVRSFIVDCGVLSGQSYASKLVQRAAGVTEDGVLGPVSMSAINGANPMHLRADILADRARFLGRIVSKNLEDKDKDGVPDNTEMAYGWFNRFARFAESITRIPPST